MVSNRQCLAGSNDNDTLERTEIARPTGDIVKISGEGTAEEKNHYTSFDFKGKTYKIDETILLTPPTSSQLVKPNVAIIRDITMKRDQRQLVLSAQLFFRPEDVERENGEAIGARELFFSFHKIEVAAETALHKCVVHVLPEEYPLPSRKTHPGFIVQEVYDLNSKKLFKLNNKQEFAHDMQQEIDVLVQKTMCHLGIYPSINNESGQEDQAEKGIPK